MTTTTNNFNIQDLVKNFSTTAKNYPTTIKGKVKCVSSADLMSNYIAGTSIDARFQFEVVQDANGDPILFSISSPEDTGNGTNVNQLYVTMRNENEPTGWKQFNISPLATDSVTIIGISQDMATGDYVLVAATASDFYITATIPSDTTKTDWTNFSGEWFERPGMPSGASVKKILVGENQTVGKLPLIIAAVQIGNSAEHYFVNGDTTATENLWTKYVLPAQTATLIDLAIGMMYFDQDYWLGTYALYTVGSDLNLTFTSVPDDNNQTHSFDLDVPVGTTVLQTLPDINNSDISTLFVSGKGLYVYESQAQCAAAGVSPVPYSEISTDSAFSDVTQMLARQDDDHVSLWVRNSSQVLWYVRGDQLGADDDAPRNWTTPLSLRQNVARIAAIRNKNRKANAVLTVKSDGQTVAYLWQDTTTTLWKDSDLALPALSTVQEFPCYTSVLAFTDENGNPVVNQEVQITSSQWTYATVNGLYKTLDNTTPQTVKTDATGKVTIINKVTGISTPSFSANAPFLTESQTVNPAKNIFAGLANIKTGQDLLNAQTKDGQDIITGDLRNNPTQLDDIAASIQQAVQMANTLPDADDSSSSIASRGTSFQPWGLSFAGGGTTFLNGDDALNLFPQSDSFTGGTVANAIVSVAGDVFEAMLNGVEKVGQILVQAAGEVYNIVVKIGEQVLSFVIQTVSDVLNLLNWVFQEIKVGLEKLIGWLGFVFDWDDIITTHKVFTNMSVQTIEYFGQLLKNAEAPITELFANLVSTVENLPILQIPEQYNVNLLSASADATAKSPPSVASTQAQVQTNSGYNFASYQAGYGGVADGFDIPAGTLPDNGLEAQLAKVGQDIIQIFKDFFDTFKDTIQDVSALYNANDLTPANFAKVFTTDFVVGLLNVVRDILITILDVADLIIEAIISLLNAEIPIPFLSGLYSKVTGGSNFTLLDCFSLFCSIPVTIGYKLMSGKAPFADGTYGLDTMSYTQMYPAKLFPNLTPDTTSFAGGDAAAAGVAESAENVSVFGVAKAIYSQVGGLMYIVSNGLSTACTVVELNIPSEAERKASKPIQRLYTTDTIFSILSFASSFPPHEGDSEIDTVEWWLDLPLWAGDGLKLLIKGIVAVGTHFEKIEEEVAEIMQGAYETVLGLCTLGLNIFSCYEEAQEEMDFWDWLKQGQNLAAGAGTFTVGLGGLITLGSEDSDDPYAIIAGLATTIFGVEMNVIAEGIALLRLGDTIVNDVGDIESVFNIR